MQTFDDIRGCEDYNVMCPLYHNYRHVFKYKVLVIIYLGIFHKKMLLCNKYEYN